jgi:hypothetical protein
MVVRLALIAGVLAASLTGPNLQAEPRPAKPDSVAIDSDDIGGLVTGPSGPEAGVWVIAETQDLPTKFRKIVVTDDRGRYVLPDLPKASYKIWARGYGLTDSSAVTSSPGKIVNLKAEVAPTPQAAAQYYPANYWLSLLNIPLKSAFPIEARKPGERLVAEGGAIAGIGNSGGNVGLLLDTHIRSQAQWIYLLKRGCEVCHQMGDKATREFPPNLGTFKNSKQAWERRILSGQVGPQMNNNVGNFGHDRGIAMFADWTDRIAAGEVPPAPQRPQGVERNIVVSLWDFGTDKSFFHDVASTNDRKVTENAYGPIIGTDFSAGALAILDPVENTASMVTVPLPNEDERKLMRPHSLPRVAAPSPFWGNEVIWRDEVTVSAPIFDSKGRLWFRAKIRANLPDYCKAGSGNPFAENFPMPAGSQPSGAVIYTLKSRKFEYVDSCLTLGSHLIFANDKDETLYGSNNGVVGGLGGIAWIKTRVWDQTHDTQKSIGWCPAILDYNGDGKIGRYTKAEEPADPSLDRAVAGASGYGIAVNNLDGSVWFAAGVASSETQVPGKIVRISPGENPPSTCVAEAYEPPFNNPKVPGVEAYSFLGIGIGTDGIVWASLVGSNQLASFDRRKCKGPLSGPAATGQHCPEGWTLYPVPGPKFKGSDVPSDFFYNNWVDTFDTLGLGKNVPVVNGTGSDSLIAFLPDKKRFVTMRVPYPLGFYTRSMSGRIDDPKAGWKGRGIWTSNQERGIWHIEGGKGSRSYVAHFQVRPNPLAK